MRDTADANWCWKLSEGPRQLRFLFTLNFSGDIVLLWRCFVRSAAARMKRAPRFVRNAERALPLLRRPFRRWLRFRLCPWSLWRRSHLTRDSGYASWLRLLTA